MTQHRDAVPGGPGADVTAQPPDFFHPPTVAEIVTRINIVTSRMQRLRRATDRDRDEIRAAIRALEREVNRVSGGHDAYYDL